ncbi:uncharacterized protein NECHADRAFT_76722 [Fusarium vanettenii 77-13-4]|uniref:Uncharacterized protein n=1 Tax=Fusarium vanettenii (strain ATCC MYA-4622 / CBS 123669 / FGSC 9596 / NRRL 45880 / 77-13-4) TaxID=660122 RepID=C7Z524_FUSV7|nr:uncharacterized protein NECHADRAFT_76722 [Fusarium vanettenii 77-13-4]EEU40445.1 hypothetical protein NECHADRAFT_76722 [Fusarium vanettenii 77-13-4]
MDLEPTKNANIGITTHSVASIDLDASPYIPPPPTEWTIEEEQREYERKSRDKASRWLNRQDSSRPAPGAIINSLPLDERMRHNGEIVGLVDTVLPQTSHSDASKLKPSSIQAPTVFAFAAHRNHDGNTFQDRLLGSNAAFQAPESTPSFSDRNSKYHDTGHHDEGRPPDTFGSDRGHASLSLQTTPPTRGVKEEHSPHPGLHQVHWASTNPSETDTCSITRKQPKRQNSRLTDDEQGTRRRQKRHRTGRRLPRASPAVPGPANSSRQAANRIPQTVPGRSRQQTQREPQSHPDPGPSNSSSFQDDRVECSPDCQFSEKNFVGSEETCFFWLHDNAKYSTSGRTACQGRKIEISHIVTHAVDHHGLIRARDPRYGNRAYLMSCQLYDPGTKATGNCTTCKSLHEWGEVNFDDPEHHGTALCLRCWCGFSKREMKAHLAGPLCSYMAEQPKSTKVYILYTTFCSKDDPPSAPPNFDTPSHGRRPPKGRNRSAAREPQPKQGRNQRIGQQTPQESSNGNQFRSLQPTGKSNKSATSRRPGALHLEVPAQNPPRLSTPAQRPPSQSSLSLSPSWRQAATRSFQSQSPLPDEIYRQLSYQDLTNQQPFGNLMYTGNLQESGMPQIQTTTPIDNFDLALRLESFFQRTPSQATASQVPSTLGEPLPIPSPDMDEPRYLLLDPDDDDDDPFQYIGSNPALQESVGRQDAPVRQQTLRPQNSSLNGLIPFGQQIKIERDSAYESGQANTEPDDSLKAMYQSAEPDSMEIDESLGPDLTKWFDFDKYEETSFTDQRFF